MHHKNWGRYVSQNLFQFDDNRHKVHELLHLQDVSVISP